MTVYEVRYKDGVDLDYFSSREAAEMYLEKYIAKLNARNATPHIPGQRGLPEPFTRDDFEIKEKQDPTHKESYDDYWAKLDDGQKYNI